MKMELVGRVAVVTGGARGIGAALCRLLAREGAQVVVADIDGDGARRVAEDIGGRAEALDVADRAAVHEMIARTEAEAGPIALFCGNAGIATGFDLDATNAAFAGPDIWQRAWEVNVMAHVHAAHSLIPRMIARGGGHFLITASAAGLLSQIGSAVYATTKHAAVGLAEALAIAHRDAGIRVALLCPQGVDTPMLHGLAPEPSRNPAAGDGVLTAEAVAEAALAALREDRFIVLPHPQVRGYMEMKARDYDGWIGAMVRFQRRFRA